MNGKLVQWIFIPKIQVPTLNWFHAFNSFAIDQKNINNHVIFDNLNMNWKSYHLQLLALFIHHMTVETPHFASTHESNFLQQYICPERKWCDLGITLYLYAFWIERKRGIYYMYLRDQGIKLHHRWLVEMMLKYKRGTDGFNYLLIATGNLSFGSLD